MKVCEPTINDLFELVELSQIFRKGCSQYAIIDDLIEDEKLKEIYTWAFLMALNLKDQQFLRILKDPINSEIVGYIFGEIHLIETYFKNRQRGFIREVYIEQTYRSFANFKILMESFFDWLKSKGIFIVEGEIDSKNEKLEQVYKHSKALEKTKYFSLILQGDDKNGQ